MYANNLTNRNLTEDDSVVVSPFQNGVYCCEYLFEDGP